MGFSSLLLRELSFFIFAGNLLCFNLNPFEGLGSASKEGCSDMLEMRTLRSEEVLGNAKYFCNDIPLDICIKLF